MKSKKMDTVTNLAQETRLFNERRNSVGNIIRDRNCYKEYPGDTEVNNEPSQTVPDDEISMSEILKRFSNGTIGEIQRDGIYLNPESFDDGIPRFDDITDVYKHIDETKSLIDQLEQARKEAAEKENATAGKNE